MHVHQVVLTVLMQRISHIAQHLAADSRCGLGTCCSSESAVHFAAPCAGGSTVVAFVSDENFSALAGVAVCIHPAGGGNADRMDTVSMADGAVLTPTPLDPARCPYTVTLALGGYGGKVSTLDAVEGGGAPAQLRLLSDSMVGYMHPKWSPSGHSAEYCIHSTMPYKLELYRCGASEQEHVSTIGWIDEHGPQTMRQVLPDGDFTQTGCGWNRVGFNSVFQSHRVVAPERGGLYYLHATQEHTGDTTSFPWIVSPEAGGSTAGNEIAVLSSTLTQCAYNHFGGRSNYFSQDGLPPQPTTNARQQLRRFAKKRTADDTADWPFEVHGAPLAFDRPEPHAVLPRDATLTDTIPGRLGTAFAPGLWRLVGWLEREGFGHDLWSDTDLHYGRLDLTRYKVLVLDMHNEYFTEEMHRKVKTWVDDGGKLAYLGGCGLYAEATLPTEQEREPDQDLAGYSYMLCHQEGKAQEKFGGLLGVQVSQIRQFKANDSFQQVCTSACAS